MPMPRAFTLTLLLATAALGGGETARGDALDTLVFGSPASEQNHALAGEHSAVFQNGLTLFGPGEIWDKEDALVFHQQKLTGDGWVQARVTDAGTAHDWTKVGVMMRESLEANAKNVFMFDSGGHGLHTQWRADTGGGTGQGDAKVAGTGPFWVRVERKGEVFTMSASADGQTWTEAGSRKMPMAGAIFMGLVNSAAGLDRLNYATFDHITSSAPAQPWTDTTIGKSAIRGGSMVCGLGEPARRLLPLDTPYYYGGDLTFRMKVDPKEQNYCSVKLWGAEGGGKMGRIVLVCEGREVGKRHGAGQDIFIDSVGAVSPGAFWYRTTILPKWLTEGQTSVEIKLRSTGSFYAYGHIWDYDTYQHKLEAPTRGLYRFYTHTNPVLASAGEVQGTKPDYAKAPKRPAPDEAAELAKRREEQNKSLGERLKKADPSQGDAEALAKAYGIRWTMCFNKPEVLAQTVRALDALCRQANADAKLAAGEWGGKFGPAGSALAALAPQMKAQLDEKTDLGAGAKPRREQYGAMLKASRDAGRFHRQTITNQCIIGDTDIFLANLGMLALGSPDALPLSTAKRYLREACGLEEYRGSDLPDGTSKWESGHGVRMMTAKGTSHEWNWCCANCYGRMEPYVHEMFRLTGDTAFRDRALQISRAHSFMTYPSVDDGGFRAMLNEGVICTRNVYHPGHAHYGYVNVASSLADPALVGSVKDGLADGQIFRTFQIGEASLYFPDDYERIRAAPAPARPLPTAPGQPDFAWADEQNALLSIKHGAEQHFLTFARRSEQGLTRIADAHSLTPQFERVVQFALDDVRFRDTGKSFTVGPEVQSDFAGKPPDKPVGAWVGRKLPILAGHPGSPADFYGTRYGDFLIGMNCSADQTFEFKPAGFSAGVDIVSGKKLTAPISVPPQTTVVLFAPADGR